MKRSLLPVLSLISLTCVTSSYAATTSLTSSWHNYIRPYVGGSVGYSATNLKIDFNTLGLTSKVDMNGAMYGGYLGVSLTPFVNNFIISVEGFGDQINNASANDALSSPAPSLYFQKKNNLGFGVLPGYQFDKLQVYGRIGMERSQFIYNSALISRLNYSRYVNGLQYGLGALYSATKNIGVRVDYARTNFSTINFTGTSGFGTNNDALKFTSNEFKLGLQWTF